MGRSIAIVEDEPLIRANYVEALNRFGYDTRGYGSRQEASSAFSVRLPELVIIDIGLGDEPEGGFDLCRELRAKSATLPIIFLTARDSDFDVISGLRLGADDYLSKDTSLHQLAARIAALFRRIESLKAPASSETVIAHGPLKLESERMRITWNDAEVPLTVTEFWMVHTLVRFPGHVKNRDQLMREAELVVDDATITSHIKRIRKKFIAVAPEFDAATGGDRNAVALDVSDVAHLRGRRLSGAACRYGRRGTWCCRRQRTRVEHHLGGPNGLDPGLLHLRQCHRRELRSLSRRMDRQAGSRDSAERMAG
jgi:two-component system OmpR family response regulator